LPKALQIAVGLAREGLSSSEPETHRAGALLLVALRDLAEVLRKRFLPVESDDCEVVFESFAKHHGPARRQPRVTRNEAQ
ncbi:MAG TPA: hypothetical protein VHW24_11660, partial [Bryobacteraceae bacterium]|nr:hypothetical protein [Bryobacteraceae bacterium]